MTTGLQGPQRVLGHAIEHGEIPGAVALVRYRGETVMHQAFGLAQICPDRRPMRLDTVFDLASLTKPLATTPVILALLDVDVLALDECAGYYIEELHGHAACDVSIRQLLTHTSGLPASYPLYTAGRTRTAVLSALARLPLYAPPGCHVEYTCLGFILLGLIAERVTGEPLDRLLRRLVLDPLDLQDTGFCPDLPPHRFAATECGSTHEQEKLREKGLLFDGWREDYIPGAVHDGNAFYALGGVSGNAGLFGTAADVGLLGQMWLNGGEQSGVRIFSATLAEEAVRDQTPHLSEPRGLGWYINRRATPGDQGLTISSGANLSFCAYGHTGFTGTSIWIDPDEALVAVLLTNYIHPAVGDVQGITTLRASFHDAIVEELV